uniref:Uncharacterized protein n=1 Tax=Anguilla anguilla TaxID=7936 RepID=A0A0E9Q307_ANGAN
MHDLRHYDFGLISNKIRA